MNTQRPIKRIYIAGRYRAATTHEIDLNIRHAEEINRVVWKRGHAAICPHLLTAHYDGMIPDEQFLAADLVLLEACDAVVLVPGWRGSVGTAGEILHAFERGIPVYEYTEWRGKNPKPMIPIDLTAMDNGPAKVALSSFWDQVDQDRAAWAAWWDTHQTHKGGNGDGDGNR